MKSLEFRMKTKGNITVNCHDLVLIETKKNVVSSNPSMSLNRRELIVNVSFLILANVLIKPYYIFFVERTIQNEVGTAAWGIYFTLFSLSMLPQIILDMGLTSFVNQKLSAQRDQFDELWGKTIWIKPILAVLFGVVFFIISWIFGYADKYPDLLGWIMVNQILLSGILFFRAFVSGLGYYRYDSFLSVADKLIFIILFTLGVIIVKISSIQSFLWIQTISLSIPLVITFIGLWRSKGIHILLKPMEVFSEKTVQILGQCLPYAGIFILMVLFCRMEPVWIDLLRSDGPVQSGIYAAAYRLLDAANMMGFLFAGILLPMFSHTIAREDAREYQSIFELAGSIMVSLAILISFTILSQHRYIMNLLYKDSLPDILPVVIINLVPLTINYLLSTFLTAAGKARIMNQYFLFSIGINVLCHILFTAKYGATGAAYSALITQTVTTIILSYLIHKTGLIRFTFSQFIKLVGSFAILIFLTILVDFLDVHPIIKLSILFATSTLIFIGLGILPVRSVLSLFDRHRS
ncbi:MAG: polysaccharide biosynthesis C-terminal domain-containing protein [Saprospiraceae bacterium]